MYNYEAIASYGAVYKQRDNVLSFFPVNSEIILCMFRSCYAHVLQISPLLPFFDIFSGTHVRPCVQVATPLAGNVTFVVFYTFPCPSGETWLLQYNRYGSLTNAIAGSQSPLISVLDGKYPGMGMKEEGIKRSRYSV